MDFSTAKHEQLIKELEALKQLADNQTHHHQSARKLLHEGLCKVYIWWRDASTEKGLLESLYDEYNIQYKQQIKNEVNFSPLLRYLWGMNGAINSNSIDQWNKALNNLHIAVLNDKEFYKVNALNKLVSYISNSGGVTALAGYADKVDENNTAPKTKLAKSAEVKLHNAHLVKGKQFFAIEAIPIAILQTPQILPSADNGFSLALIRKSNNGYEVLSAVDDKSLIEQAVVAAYKRTSEQMPNTARLLTEIIRTQALPSKIAALTASLADNSKYKVSDSNELMKQLKRLLYVAKDGTFVLSANRSECSVVSVATPFAPIFKTTDDLALAVGDRTYIENNLIQSGDFNFYTADEAELVPATENEAASHKLKLENTVTKEFRYVRFYPLSVFNFAPSRTQAVVKSPLHFKPSYTVELDSKWISEMYALFLVRWIEGLGAKIKRAEHKILMLALDKTGITFKHTYKANDFKEIQSVPFNNEIVANGCIEVHVLSKDVIPVLNALVQMEVDGNVTLQADDKMLRFMFKTNCADYSISVPCCTLKAKRIGDYFEAYGA